MGLSIVTPKACIVIRAVVNKWRVLHINVGNDKTAVTTDIHHSMHWNMDRTGKVSEILPSNYKLTINKLHKRRLFWKTISLINHVCGFKPTINPFLSQKLFPFRLSDDFLEDYVQCARWITWHEIILFFFRLLWNWENVDGKEYFELR